MLRLRAKHSLTRILSKQNTSLLSTSRPSASLAPSGTRKSLSGSSFSSRASPGSSSSSQPVPLIHRRNRNFSSTMNFPAPHFTTFQLALVQLGQIGADKQKNLVHARDMITKAASGNEGRHPKPHLIVLPECFNSPYGVNHFPDYAEEIGYLPGKPYDAAKSKSPSVQMLSEAAKETSTWLLGGSIPERDVDGKIYNTMTVYNPKGELVAMHRKLHLFDINIPGKITFIESETLTAGNSLNYFDTEFARIGLGICYDVRFPEMAMIAARNGAHIMIYPGAFNLTTGPMHWELLQRARAVDNQIFVSMCSPARDLSAGYHAWGHSMIVDPLGKVLVEAKEEEDIVFAVIDPKVLEEARAGIPVTTQRRFDVYPDVSAA